MVNIYMNTQNTKIYIIVLLITISISFISFAKIINDSSSFFSNYNVEILRDMKWQRKLSKKDKDIVKRYLNINYSGELPKHSARICYTETLKLVVLFRLTMCESILANNSRLIYTADKQKEKLILSLIRKPEPIYWKSVKQLFAEKNQSWERMNEKKRKYTTYRQSYINFYKEILLIKALKDYRDKSVSIPSKLKMPEKFRLAAYYFKYPRSKAITMIIDKITKSSTVDYNHIFVLKTYGADPIQYIFKNVTRQKLKKAKNGGKSSLLVYLFQRRHRIPMRKKSILKNYLSRHRQIFIESRQSKTYFKLLDDFLAERK